MGYRQQAVPKVAAVHADDQPSQNHQILKGVLVVVANITMSAITQVIRGVVAYLKTCKAKPAVI